MLEAHSNNTAAAGGGGGGGVGESKEREIFEQVRYNPFVFIRDKDFAWLPAELTSPIEDGDMTASVKLSLPSDWHDYTCNSSKIEERNSNENGQDGYSMIRMIKLSDYPGRRLPLRSVGMEGSFLSVSNMSELPFLHEAAILYNLKDRHKKCLPYTRVGEILVAVNPYQWIKGLYSKEKKAFYAERLIWDNTASTENNTAEKSSETSECEPHVYVISSRAYRDLAAEKQNQSILVSGESGAGKTETVKILLTHLATVQTTRVLRGSITGEGSKILSNERTGVVNKILESTPVFEAFGNARTVRNGNSSRFGKFTKLLFEVNGSAGGKDRESHIPLCFLAGSSFETCLLEKSRVVKHDAGERNFHIFYQLLNAPDEFKSGVWDGLKGATHESFRYLQGIDVLVSDSLIDADAWDQTKNSLALFGLSGDKLSLLMKSLCTVLQLGNITFGPSDIDEERTVITSDSDLEKVSELMGIAPKRIHDAMTTRILKTGGEQIVAKLSPTASKDSCDALAKEIYSQLFESLVEAINQSTLPSGLLESDKESRSTYGSISLLDLFGFESFEVNRFEQLCINYANERLQHRYVWDNFKSIQDEYEAEGIKLHDFSMDDDSAVVELMEGRMGLIAVLNDECIRPKGNDSSFVYKVKMIHKDSPHLVSEKLHLPWEFGVTHFAGKITYDARSFVERNTDKIPKDLLECASLSSNDMIRSCFQRLLDERIKSDAALVKKREAVSKTICSRLKTQLKALMADIAETRTLYIKCIKPNNEQKPSIMDHNVTMRQLGSVGLMNAVAVCQKRFSHSLSYAAVWERYRCLSSSAFDHTIDVRENVKHLLSKLLKNEKGLPREQSHIPYACGKTKVFIRAEAIERLNVCLSRRHSDAATIIQCWARRIGTQRKYECTKEAFIVLQAHWRSRAVYRSYSDQRKAAVRLQCWARRISAGLKLRHLKEQKYCVLIQNRWRIYREKKELERMKHAVDLLRRAVKSKKSRTSFTATMAVCVDEARKDAQMKRLQKKLRGYDNSVDKDELLKESERMIFYLGNELFKHRGMVSDLRAELSKEKETNRGLGEHIDSIEASLAASKLEHASFRKYCSGLERQVDEYKSDASSTRTSLKHELSLHDLWKRKKEEEFNSAQEMFLKKTRDLEEQMEQLKNAHSIEVAKLKHEVSESHSQRLLEVSKLNEELETMQESYNEDLSNMLEALEAAHERAEESEREARESTAREAQIADLRDKMESLAASHHTEIENMKREQESQHKSCAVAEAEAAELRHRISEILLEHARELESLQSDLEEQRQKLASSEKEVYGLQNELNALRSSQETHVEKLVSSHSSETETMKEALESQRNSCAVAEAEAAQMRNRVDEILLKHAKEMESLKSDLEEQRQRSISSEKEVTDLQNEIIAIRNSHEAQVERLNADLDAQKGKSAVADMGNSELRSQMEDLKAAHTNEVRNLKQKIDTEINKLSSAETEVELVRKQLQILIASSNAEEERLRKELSELNSKLTSTEAEAVSLRDQCKKLMSAEADAEELREKLLLATVTSDNLKRDLGKSIERLKSAEEEIEHLKKKNDANKVSQMPCNECLSKQAEIDRLRKRMSAVSGSPSTIFRKSKEKSPPPPPPSPRETSAEKCKDCQSANAQIVALRKEIESINASHDATWEKLKLGLETPCKSCRSRHADLMRSVERRKSWDRSGDIYERLYRTDTMASLGWKSKRRLGSAVFSPTSSVIEAVLISPSKPDRDSSTVGSL